MGRERGKSTESIKGIKKEGRLKETGEKMLKKQKRKKEFREEGYTMDKDSTKTEKKNYQKIAKKIRKERRKKTQGNEKSCKDEIKLER